MVENGFSFLSGEHKDLGSKPGMIESNVWQDLGEVLQPTHIFKRFEINPVPEDLWPHNKFWDGILKYHPYKKGRRSWEAVAMMGHGRSEYTVTVSLLSDDAVISPSQPDRHRMSYLLQLIPGQNSILGKLGIKGPLTNRESYIPGGVSLHIQLETGEQYPMDLGQVVPQDIYTPKHELISVPPNVRKFWLTGSNGVFDASTKGYNPYLHIGLRLYERIFPEPKWHYLRNTGQVVVPIPTARYPYPMLQYISDYGGGAGSFDLVEGYNAATTDARWYNRKRIQPGLYVIIHGIVSGEHYEKRYG